MRARVVLVCAIVLAACANGKRDAEQVDGDVSVMEDAAPEIDAPKKNGFGEPCTSNNSCESGLCILVGTSGQCTQTCGDCPPGYGCLGVTGIQVEGQVTFVCVPQGNQLCTGCTQDSECTLIGMDKCVTYPDGDRACAQDCSTVSCPTGYTCNNVVINNVNYKQCMAASGACDCTAANPGAMQPCNITTPWNVCMGSQTCGGASGWGTCQPPSTNDDPDPSFVDSNCDGIDGDRMRGIFVSLIGNNTSTCGLDYNDPCQSISWGIARAMQTSRPHVYLQAGTFNVSTVSMVSGISIFGGYDANWRRALYSQAGHTVTISGGNPTVRFNAINQPTMIDNLVIRSADAGAGASAMGVLATTSQFVTLRSVLVQPGSGGAGNGGADGTIGATGGNGGIGTPGCEDSGALFCTNCARPAAGLAGASSCGHPGGVGGQPGNGGGAGAIGTNGTVASGCPGGQGCGGAGAPCGGLSTCDGQAGFAGSNGSAGGNGTGGAGFGSFSGTTYVTADGSNGATGNPGNGGGGGGGGGGGDDDCDSYGSSGGGGGGGGCGGTFGTRGFGGGGSFGVVASDSEITLNASIVSSGSGGVGGRGGSGGSGGMGGSGGPGGPYGGGSEQDDGGDGAPGGGGGTGGRGGDGGGGGGGPSISVVCLGTSANTVTILGTTLTPGTGGTGGMSGAPGMMGTSAMTFGCN